MIAAAVAAAAVGAQLGPGAAGTPAPAPQAGVPTYSKDVAPILQQNCQTCHRPGEAGPFSLLTYQDARRRAAKIRDAVADRIMPPWFADPHYGTFSNALGLSASDRDAILRWADGGTPEGDPRDLPKPVAWVEGWGIGKPDLVVEMPTPFEVPAHGRRRVSARHRPDALHRGSLDPGGGDPAHRAGGRASPHRLRPRAEIEVVPRPAGRRLLHGAEGQHG